MTETPIRAFMEVFFQFFPMGWFLDMLRVLATLINGVLGALGIDFPVAAF